MANIFELRTEWVPPSGISTESVHYIGTAGNIAVARAALDTFYDNTIGIFSSQQTWRIATTGKILDDTSGQLLGLWNESTDYSYAGTGTQQPMADASQMLARFYTGVVRGGRFVQGRWFLPGVTVGALQNGNIGSGTRTNVNAHLDNLMAPVNAFGVWSRPVEGRPGLWLKSQSAEIAPEVAVMRRRRNR